MESRQLMKHKSGIAAFNERRVQAFPHWTRVDLYLLPLLLQVVIAKRASPMHSCRVTFI